VYIACSSLCFGQKPFQQAVRTINDLHFQKVDLAIHEDGPHLKPSEIHADVNRAAAILRSTNSSYAAFHLEIQAETEEKYRDIFRSVCRLARIMAVPVLNIQAAPEGTELATEAKRLSGLVRLAEADGIILTVETATGRITSDAKVCAELCKKCPGLGLTLDPSPFHSGPTGSDNFDEVYPFVRHVRLRDTSKEKYQVMIGQGEVEYGKIINQLTRSRYDRALTVDIRDYNDSEFPTEPEVRKLKYLLESMV
jgi:sugar phosphate isomerase/epimerase